VACGVAELYIIKASILFEKILTIEFDRQDSVQLCNTQAFVV
jgi:hypothetical protein